MRELKFRAWSLERKCYVDVWEITFDDEGLPSVLSFEYNGLLYNEPAHDFIIEQYTGLKDKKGKEIYEGDIIDFFGEKYPVIYRAGCFWAEYSKTQKDYLFLYATDSEVIGNIHENPELIKEASNEDNSEV